MIDEPVKLNAGVYSAWSCARVTRLVCCYVDDDLSNIRCFHQSMSIHLRWHQFWGYQILFHPVQVPIFLNINLNLVFHLTWQCYKHHLVMYEIIHIMLIMNEISKFGTCVHNAFNQMGNVIKENYYKPDVAVFENTNC